MSTRSTLTFTDEFDSFNVYKHNDGYPSGIVDVLERTLEFAWTLPRFEADEFAAAFIAAVKTNGDDQADEFIAEHPDDKEYQNYKLRYRQGAIRLLLSGSWEKVAPCDIEFHYDISIVNQQLHVKAYTVTVNNWENLESQLIFEGSLAKFKKFAENWEKN